MRRVSLVIVVLSLAILMGALLVAAQQDPVPTSLFEAFVLEIRQDIEALADEQFGVDSRPANWTGNFDLQSESAVPDLWFDNEQLADAVFGAAVRPDEWFGITSNNAELIARNVRHDVELIADDLFGSIRPEEWNSAPARFRCNRTQQNVLRLLDLEFNSRPETPEFVADYCGAVRSEIETQLILVVFERDVFAGQLPVLSLALRGDLERLRDEVLGVNIFPPQWTNNRDEASESLIADTAADLEVLASEILGVNVRPDNWAPFIGTVPSLAYRNMRFNLELLTDIFMGEDIRPRGWQGEDPTEECAPLTQGLYFLVRQIYNYEVPEDLTEVSNICAELSAQINDYAENPPAPEDIVDGGGDGDTRYVAEAEYAFAYLDVAALQYMGIMPGGTTFRAWYRNFNESSMMFVSGDDFALFIDHRWTTMEEDIFNTLPTLDGVRPLTFCDANWCNGPGPTPTPTGGSPLELLVYSTTPQPTLDVSSIGEQGKQQVSWNHIRVTYLLDNQAAGTVQVTLEICASPAQVACEPVLSVFENTTGTFKPVLSQFNGLNVYDFRYGFNNQVVIESENFVSPDIWISDPTIR